MKDLFKDYLFDKHVLVATKKPDSEESFNTLVALANKLDIRITKGMEYASQDMIEYAANRMGIYIPAPFYRGFPESVRKLSQDKLLFDQLFYYVNTYGFGDFDNPGHSVFEEDYDRLVFNEDTTPKYFEILTENEAITRMCQAIGNLLESSRPLNEHDYEIVRAGIDEFKIFPKSISCKQTAIKLMYDTKNVNVYAEFISLADVVKLVDYINYSVYDNENLKNLKFRNQDRKFVSKVIDFCFENSNPNVKECFEKRKIWCGLLHHIHYIPKTHKAEVFVKLIREGKNISAYSFFEEEMRNGNIVKAAEILHNEKGNSVVIRNLNYLLSRCKSDEEVKGVLSWLK